MAEWAIVPVPVDKLAEVLPHIQPLILEAVAAYDGRHTYQSMMELILAEHVVLFVAAEGGTAHGLIGAQISQEPSGLRTCQFRFVSGPGFRRWSDLALDTVEAFAKHHGCHRMEGMGRKGLAKAMPDYKITHVMLEKDLR